MVLLYENTTLKSEKFTKTPNDFFSSIFMDHPSICLELAHPRVFLIFVSNEYLVGPQNTGGPV